MKAERQIARQILLQGLVQGQGVRPTIARLARECGIGGDVRNSGRGVELNLMGNARRIAEFQRQLTDRFTVQLIELSSRLIDEVARTDNFVILPSIESSAVQTVVPTDLGICAECVADIQSPGSRWFRYPFTSCTRCGPRYSIIRSLPYDRSRTSMNDFPMCKACEAEYRDPQDRRYHGQTNACPVCGPSCWSVNEAGQTTARGSEAIEQIAIAIRLGKIAAVKGLGGYQFICDATQDEAVARLRQRKHRPRKPLPIMVRDADCCQMLAHLNDVEMATLCDKSNPIVLLRSKFHVSLSQHLHPGLVDIGIMLPTTPLHWLLTAVVDRPIVVTSGNLPGTPIAYRNEQAMSSLAGVADVWLHHDRPIIRPVDDSVVRCSGGNPITIRAARGIAPLTLSESQAPGTLAVGGQQKCAVAISTGKHLILGPHVGDLDSEATRARFQTEAEQFCSLYGVSPVRLACDAHPDYFTNLWANQSGKAVVRVQHHHAHVVAAMLDHGLRHETVLGFAFDGTGYGSDATVWGGEVLLASASDFQRVARLRSFSLPGGEVAIQQPWRVAMALLSQACQPQVSEDWLTRFQQSGHGPAMRYAIRSGPRTTSIGRLFDAVAAMVLSPLSVSYEGEPAMLLEAACDRSESSSYEFRLTKRDGLTMDWRPIIQAIVTDLNTLTPARIAMKFHRSVAAVVLAVAEYYRNYPIVLSGGVFQNRLLTELIQESTSTAGLDFHFPGRVPINDGGLAIGQLAIAGSHDRLHNGDAIPQTEQGDHRSCV